MSKYTREDILRIVDEEDVEFIRLQFTDIYGTLKNVAITRGNLVKALTNKYMFDCSAIEGFVNDEESDMFLYPDLDTFTIFPWRPQQGKVARLICNVYRPDGTPLQTDPRYVLKKVLKEAEDMGYSFNAGPECEFFLFHSDDLGRPTTITHEQAGYFDLGPSDLGENIRRDMVLTLEDMGFDIASSHHEGGVAQHEIDFKYDEALIAADDIITFKLAVRTIAKKHGLHATFMPKPTNGKYASGMHINMSLAKDGINVFYDEKDKYGLSCTAYHFMAGILKHTKGMMVFTNPLINSYKRLASGYDAPDRIGWSRHCKSSLIRVPYSDAMSARIELRSPDPSSNPYIVLALCLAAGLDGIKNKLDPADYFYSSKNDNNNNQNKLPLTMQEAIDEFYKDPFIQETVGKELCENYLNEKKRKWEEFSSFVTDWETNECLSRY